MRSTKLTDEGKLALRTREGRVFLSSQSFFQFISIYLFESFPLDPALFHGKLIETLEECNDFIAVIGFRGSAKSTILEAFALWSMVTGRSPFTMYISVTDDKSRQSVKNIKSILEADTYGSKLLRADFGIFFDKKQTNMLSEKWSESQITVHGCTIVAKSRGAKGIRGTKTDTSRLTMIICDDLEDVDSCRTSEARAKTREWFYTEVVPATAQGILASDVKIVMLGNLVHRDCLIVNLKNKKLDNESIVNVIEFPLIDEAGQITWPALYPTMADVEKQKAKVMLAGAGLGSIIWAREYLLKHVDEESQVIKASDIQYYDDEWLQKAFERGAVGVDLAISEKQSADYTSMVKAVLVKNEYGERRCLILPNPVHGHLSFTDTIHKARDTQAIMPQNTTFYVEGVAYQKAAIEVMKKNGINVTEVLPKGDKRSRLVGVSTYIKTGIVLFPKEGASGIIEEVVGLGIEAHDDLCDAMVYAIDGLLNTRDVYCV